MLNFLIGINGEIPFTFAVQNWGGVPYYYRMLSPGASGSPGLVEIFILGCALHMSILDERLSPKVLGSASSEADGVHMQRQRHTAAFCGLVDARDFYVGGENSSRTLVHSTCGQVP
jgi:hypothetical protein